MDKKNYQKAVQFIVEMIEQGYGQSEIEAFTPEDYKDNFGITISQEDIDAAIDKAIEQTCVWNNEEFWNN